MEASLTVEGGSQSYIGVGGVGRSQFYSGGVETSLTVEGGSQFYNGKWKPVLQCMCWGGGSESYSEGWN